MQTSGSPAFLHTPGLPYSRPNTPSAHPSSIGFVGIGAMGYFMAKNLATYRLKHASEASPVRVWNRTASKAENLAKELGDKAIKVSQTLEDILVGCDIIITNLSNDAVVKSVYEQFFKSLSQSQPHKPKIFVETSTIYPSLAGELDQLITAIPHCHLICSPVFGTPAVAKAAQLLIIMSGDYHSKKEVAYHLVPAVGRKVIDLGGNLEKAPTFKLLGNSMIMGHLEILAEAHTLAEKSGIGYENLHHLVQELFPAPGIVAYSEKMTHDKFDGTVGFAIDGGIKDATHVRRLTAEHNSPMPVVDIAHQHMLTARAIHQQQVREGKQKFDVLDWSSLVTGLRVGAGLSAFASDGAHAGVVKED